MAEQYQEFRRAGAEVLAVVSDSPQAAQAYFRQHHIPFPCLVDQEHRAYDLYQVASTALSLGQRPGMFVVDRDGVVRYAHIGWQQWEIPKNAEVLEVCHHSGCVLTG